MKILLTGAKGQTGYELARVLPLLGTVTAVDIEELDLAKPERITEFMRSLKPDIVVNSAAFTLVDTAEENVAKAGQVNSIAPGIIAEELKKTKGLMVHFSTDYAYDGEKKTPYNEEDELNPLSVYAKSKIAGDIAIIDSGVKHIIFRTSWLYGGRGKNFLTNMLSICEKQNELTIVNDQIGAPTWTRLLAQAVGLVLSRKEAYDPLLSGLYHISSAGWTTWYEFAVEIAKYYEHKTRRRIAVFPASTGEYPMKAKRPKYSILSNTKLNTTFDVFMPEWQYAFKLVMEDLGYPASCSSRKYP